MPFDKGFTLALELSNIFPVKEVIQSSFERVLEYARSLRKSGSDIVVEEDLAILLGRGRISPELEHKFKDDVKVQGTTELHQDCEVMLDYGQGPTVNRSLRDPRYLSTVIQLTMLAYFHNRHQLGGAISQLMTKRFELAIEGASPGPGAESIVATIATCSSQTSAFDWSRYSQDVQDRIRSVVPNYQYSPAYIRLSSSTLLAVIDLFYLAQSLPSNRRISVSSEVGCVTLIIWAHYILQLNISIVLPNNNRITFGAADESQVVIRWCGTLENIGDLTWPSSIGLMQDPQIRLHERNMDVILDYEEIISNRTFVRVEDRHPVAGYGLTYLKRLLNIRSMIFDTDPIYEDSIHLIVALTVHCVERLFRRSAFDSDPPDPRHDLERNFAETWRVLEAGKLIFEGVEIDVASVKNFTRGLQRESLSNLISSPTFQPFLEKVALEENIKSKEDRFMEKIQFLAGVVLVFSHVQELKSCASMPILMSVNTLVGVTKAVADISTTSKARGYLYPQGLFHALVGLLSTTNLNVRDDTYGVTSRISGMVSLCSDFGWSIFFDTYGESDPAETRPEILHVQRGTPVKANSGERKICIRDGVKNPTKTYPNSYPLEHGASYKPRAAAGNPERTEEWTSRSSEFEQTVYYSIIPSDE